MNYKPLKDEEWLRLWDTRMAEFCGKYPASAHNVVNFGHAVEAAVLARVSAPLPAPDIEAGLSWSGFNLYGDKKSIDRAKQAIHDSDVWVPCLRAKLEELRAAPTAAPLPVEPEPVAHMWQHGETGMTGFVEHAPLNELAHWEHMNRPRKIVSPLYAHPARTATSPDTLAAIRQGIEALEDIRRYTAGPIGWWRQVRDVIASLQAAERSITKEKS